MAEKMPADPAFAIASNPSHNVSIMMRIRGGGCGASKQVAPQAAIDPKKEQVRDQFDDLHHGAVRAHSNLSRSVFRQSVDALIGWHV